MTLDALREIGFALYPSETEAKMEVEESDQPETDLYVQWKDLQQDLQYMKEQEGYIKFEIKQLRHELLFAKREIKRIQSVPLLIGQFNEMVDEDYAVVSSANDTFYVRVLSTLNREDLKPNCSIALHKH